MVSLRLLVITKNVFLHIPTLKPEKKRKLKLETQNILLQVALLLRMVEISDTYDKLNITANLCFVVCLNLPSKRHNV